MKVSFTISVYNTEKYIPQCVESLLNQTHKDWEAVFVDDGSTDGSLSLLNDYAEKDHRIKVIKMPCNGGQAKARNAGLKLCTGDVVSFLDSDDWLSEDALESMVSVFENNPDTGCVLYDCILVYPDYEEPFTDQYFSVLSGNDAALKAIKWDGIHGYYAVRNEIHQAYPYDETVKWYSDDNTTFMHFMASQEVRYCSGKYYYRMREGSVTHEVNVHHFDILEAKDSMRDILTKMKASEEARDILEDSRWRALIDCYMYFFIHRNSFSENERKQIILRMKKYWFCTNKRLLPTFLRKKFGYMKCQSWTMFVTQEEIYFTLRKLMGKL